MKKKYFCYILILAALVLSASVCASASGGYFVNDALSRLPDFFDGVYAIGAGGTDLLVSDQVYALSASGLEMLGGAGANGGGGLVSESGSVGIRSDKVKVGLFYKFSEARDNTVESSILLNPAGGGFEFGCYDDEGEFQPFAETQASRITMRPEENGTVSAYISDTEDYICSLDHTSKDNYLIVRPSPYDAFSQTTYIGVNYYGEFGYAVIGNEKLTVINVVDIELYVMGVCAVEMTESWPLEALKAQAVAARTFAQRNIGRSVYYDACGFDVTNDTYCQVYRGMRGVGGNIWAAAVQTTNRYLTRGGALIEALYSAADGGATEDAENVFGYPNAYLRGVADPYEAAAENENPYSSWVVTLTPKQLGTRVGIGPVASVTQTRSRTGNVTELELVSTSGQRVTLQRDRCRTALQMRSIHYEISRDSDGNFVFTGGGFGHNVGMSQWGAYAMAKYYEKDYRFILGFYYTGVELSYGWLQ